MIQKLTPLYFTLYQIFFFTTDQKKRKKNKNKIKSNWKWSYTMNIFCIFGMKKKTTDQRTHSDLCTEQNRKKIQVWYACIQMECTSFCVYVTIASWSPTHEWRQFYSMPNILYETQTSDLVLGNTMYVCERRNNYTVLIAYTLKRRTTLLIFFAYANFSSLPRFLLFSNNTLQLFTFHATCIHMSILYS